MKLIVKDNEPLEWTEFRNTPGTNYESKPCLRQALYQEQGGICAYCSRRLFDEFSNGTTTNRIEHIKAQSKCTREERMHYTNMVLCCNGRIYNNDTSDNNTICDLHRKNDDISISPLNKSCIDSISYSTTGRILSSNFDWNKDINKTLNLNHPVLVSNRRSSLTAIIATLGKKKDWKISEIKSMIKKFENRNADGLFEPNSDIIVWQLKKWASHKGVTL